MRRISIGLIFCEVKCVVFRGMQQMSHDHVCYYHLYICVQLYWERFKKASELFGTKKTLNFSSECLLSRAMAIWSRTETKK